MWFTPPPEALRYVLEFPRATPSNNEIKGMHPHVYRELRETWALLVFAAIKGRRPKQPIQTSFICIERRSYGSGLDWDNAYGGLKPLLDCLVMPSKRNPSGFGLVADDNPKAMPYPPLLTQLPASISSSSARVEIYDVANLPFQPLSR